jgi:hypothetical protein
MKLKVGSESHGRTDAAQCSIAVDDLSGVYLACSVCYENRLMGVFALFCWLHAVARHELGRLNLHCGRCRSG